LTWADLGALGGPGRAQLPTWARHLGARWGVLGGKRRARITVVTKVHIEKGCSVMRQIEPQHAARFGECIGRCESPIEQRFLAALLFLSPIPFVPDSDPFIAKCSRSGLSLGMQCQIEGTPYRADFVLMLGSKSQYIIELDGYVHHGAKPEQFVKDAERQRALTTKGWTVLRYAGREVFLDPIGVTKNALSRVMSRYMPDLDAWLMNELEAAEVKRQGAFR
jgi:very-short-patch-repair endonuclease